MGEEIEVFKIRDLLRLVFWDRFFGDGRLLEGFLIFIKYTYGIMFVASDFLDIPPVVVAFKDIAPEDPTWIGLPFFTMATLSTIGLFLNALGFDSSKYYRILGAIMGITMWLFVLGMDIFVYGILFAGVHPWMVGSIIGSAWIIRRSVKGQPLSKIKLKLI